jgi:VWFA-related protein
MMRALNNLPARGLLFLLALTLAATSASAQEEPAPDASQTFEGSTSIRIIEVPVRVLQKGDPIRGLTQANFEVYDNGEPQELIGFEVVDSGTEWIPEELPTGEVLPLQERRNFFFLFDFAYGGNGLVDARRRLIESAAAVRTLIEEELTPSDNIAIGFFSSLRGIKLISDFTRDRDQTMMAMHAIDLILDAKPQVIRQEFEGWAPLGPQLPGRKNKTPLGPNRPSLEDLAIEARTWSQRGDPFLQHDNVIKHFTWGMREFLEDHEDLGGMNYMVLISKGMLYGDNPTQSLARLQEMFRDMRDANWSIQAISTGGLDFGRSSLTLLTNETGGRLFANSRDFNLMFDEMATSTSVTYMLAFQVADQVEDGKFHKISVKLVDGPKRAKLSHRPGYYAPGVIEPKWNRSSSTPDLPDD